MISVIAAILNVECEKLLLSDSKPTAASFNTILLFCTR